jgi:hypothetical protein
LGSLELRAIQKSNCTPQIIVGFELNHASAVTFTGDLGKNDVGAGLASKVLQILGSRKNLA